MVLDHFKKAFVYISHNLTLPAFLDALFFKGPFLGEVNKNSPKPYQAISTETNNKYDAEAMSDF